MSHCELRAWVALGLFAGAGMLGCGGGVRGDDGSEAQAGAGAGGTQAAGGSNQAGMRTCLPQPTLPKQDPSCPFSWDAKMSATSCPQGLQCQVLSPTGVFPCTQPPIVVDTVCCGNQWLEQSACPDSADGGQGGAGASPAGGPNEGGAGSGGMRSCLPQPTLPDQDPSCPSSGDAAMTAASCLEGLHCKVLVPTGGFACTQPPMVHDAVCCGSQWLLQTACPNGADGGPGAMK